MRPSVEVAQIEGYRYGCADPHDTQPTTRVHTESGDSRLEAAPIEVSASLIVVFALCRSCDAKEFVWLTMTMSQAGRQWCGVYMH